MKKQLKFIVAVVLAVGSLASISEAGCDHITAVNAVIGKTYSARNRPDYPKLLSFYADGAASFGSALDGHPGGTFYYGGACMNRIVVEFVSSVGSQAGLTHEMFLLYPQDGKFDVLVDKYTGQKFYKE
jgi:hypothetical protein